jgi:hypothetical protein
LHYKRRIFFIFFSIELFLALSVFACMFLLACFCLSKNMQSGAEHAKTTASFCMVLLKQNQSGAEHAKTAKAPLSMRACFCLSKNSQSKKVALFLLKQKHQSIAENASMQKQSF